MSGPPSATTGSARPRRRPSWHTGGPPGTRPPGPQLISLDDLLAARDRVKPVIRGTPVDRSDSLSRLAGRAVLLKPEHQQRTGSFKIRGAYNRIAQLRSGIPVVAASAGNHA